MSSPADDEQRLLHELRDEVAQELADDEAGDPAQEPDGTPTQAWLEDPYLPRYETALHALVDAVEGEIEEIERPGSAT
jgi:hypothetical protein